MFGAPALASSIAQDTKGDTDPQLKIDNGIIGENRVIEIKDDLQPPAGVNKDVIVVNDKGDFAKDLEKNAIVVDDNVLFSKNMGQIENDTSVQAGRATIIKSTYVGETPTYVKPKNSVIPQVATKSVEVANNQILQANAKAKETGKSFRNYLTDFYDTVFENMGGARGIEVDGLKFKDKSYIVTINKNAVGKVISDPNLSAEKLAVFDVIDDVVENGEYVGSGNYRAHGAKVKNIVRYDYFETPVTIDGKKYLATFDVEVVPGKNNYRTHRVINEINLTQIPSGEVGTLPTAQGNALGLFTTNIPQQQNLVNSAKMADNESTQVEPLRFAGTEEYASDKANNVIDRLSRGEKVSIDEINSIPEVINAYTRVKEVVPTSGISTVERKNIRRNIAETVNNYGSAVKTIVDGKPLIAYNGVIKQDRKAHIVIGLPASGKSSALVDQLSEEYKARVIDSDIVKELLPEFDNGYGAGVVHEESKAIANDWLDEAVINGDNIVHPIVGSDIKKVIDKIEMLKEEGYTVYLHLNELSNGKATGRMLRRFFTDGRFLNPNLMSEYENKPTQVYNAIKELEGLIDGYSKYSDDVEYGQEPRLIERKMDISDDIGDDGGQSNGWDEGTIGSEKGSDGKGSSSQASNVSRQPSITTEVKDTSSDVSFDLDT